MAVARIKQEFDCGKSLFLKEEFGDVEILVESNGSICRYPCHKIILSASSEVFATMFNSMLSEKETGKVTITDISPDIMLILLTYIYGGSVDFDCWKTAVDVLRAAHKYQIESLINHCEIYLSENLTLRNVCFILNSAILYDLADLKTKCLKLCKYGGFLILKSSAFTHLSTCAVREILNGNSLFVETEINVFKALWEWATMECCRKQRKITEENIFAQFLVFSKYVKFESMTSAELESLPKTTFKYVSDKKRKKLTNEENVVEKSSISALARIDPSSSDMSEGLESYLITKFFTFGGNSSVTSSSENDLSLLRFSVDTDVYLTSFVLLPITVNSINRCIKSFRLVCKGEILAGWPKMGKLILKLNDKGERYAFVRCNDRCQELIVQVHGLVLLKAGEEYSMEVEANNIPLKWPNISLIDTKRYRQDDVKLFVHSKSSFGVDQMTFLRSNCK